MKGQVFMFNGNMKKTMDTIALMKDPLDNLADARCDILTLKGGEVFKKDLEEKCEKAQSDMEIYQEKVAKFFSKSVPITTYFRSRSCKILKRKFSIL